MGLKLVLSAEIGEENCHSLCLLVYMNEKGRPFVGAVESLLGGLLDGGSDVLGQQSLRQCRGAGQ